MNKKIIILVIILVILGVGFYIYNKKQALAPSSQTVLPNPDMGNLQPSSNTQNDQATSSSPNTQTPVKGSTGGDYLPPKQSGGGENTGSDIQVLAVDYDGVKFTPDALPVHVGDYVFFRNKSTQAFWPKSTAPGGFDAGKSIAAGGEFKFQFTQAGTWTYADHLHPSITGTITVSQ